MDGTVVIIVVLLVFPVIFLIGSLLVTAVFGWSLNAEVDARHEGSELLGLAYPDDS